MSGRRDGARELLARCTFPPAGTAVACAFSGGADSTALVALAAAAGLPRHRDPRRPRHPAESADEAAQAGARRRARRRLPARRRRRRSRARTSRPAPGPPASRPCPPAPSPATRPTTRPRRCWSTCSAARARRAGGDGSRAHPPAARPAPARDPALCADLGLASVADPSNDDPRFVRNRIRHELLPLLDDIAGRDVVPLAAPHRRRGRRRRWRCSTPRPPRSTPPTPGRSPRRRRARPPGAAPLAHRRRLPTRRGDGRPGPRRRPRRPRRLRGGRRAPRRTPQQRLSIVAGGQ